ncbi:MAG: enoyl-ACP reductase [Gammaproteobacteria bacterium]|nr:enoyl-ACP reductase [Gammaproteobacteria bacterium]
MGFLDGKRALIVGLANNRSIAWGVAKAMHREGAELAFTYQNDKLKSRVEALAAELGVEIILPCDVASDAEIEAMYAKLAGHWDGLDSMVHSVAFAPKEQLEDYYHEHVTREGFKIAHDISAYSFTALANAGLPMMAGRNASLVALTYMGSVRAVPKYNVMGVAKASLEASVRYLAFGLGPQGIRVNAVSAGAIRTLAAAGISEFRRLLDYSEKNAPLRRNVTIDEVGNAVAFLCSDLASAITGEVMYVDAGIHITAMGTEAGAP